MQKNVLSGALVRLVLVVLMGSSSACSIYSVPGSTPAPVEDRPGQGGRDTVYAPEVESSPKVDQPASPTVAAYGPLLEQAQGARAQGDYEGALSLLERAQRIDPDNPEIYLAMAQTHDARGDYDQARATAERGLLYCRAEMNCDALRAYVP